MIIVTRIYHLVPFNHNFIGLDYLAFYHLSRRNLLQIYFLSDPYAAFSYQCSSVSNNHYSYFQLYFSHNLSHHFAICPYAVSTYFTSIPNTNLDSSCAPSMSILETLCVSPPYSEPSQTFYLATDYYLSLFLLYSQIIAPYWQTVTSRHADSSLCFSIDFIA